MKIGILVTGHVPEEMQAVHGDYDVVFARYLAGKGLSFDPYFVVDGHFPKGPDAAGGWLITGSKHGAYENHDWIPPLETLIRDIHAKRLPLVGICFGHQIIAQALGGKVEKFAGGWAIGPTTYDGASGATTLHAWHQDQVVVLPQDAEVLAGNELCKNAILSYGKHIWTVQPHPEFTNAYFRDLAAARKGVVPDQKLSDALERLGAKMDNDDIAAHIAAFFQNTQVTA